MCSWFLCCFLVLVSFAVVEVEVEVEVAVAVVAPVSSKIEFPRLSSLLK